MRGRERSPYRSVSTIAKLLPMTVLSATRNAAASVPYSNPTDYFTASGGCGAAASGLSCNYLLEPNQPKATGLQKNGSVLAAPTIRH